MAFSVEYIYNVIDRFSGPLQRITRQTNKFTSASAKASQRIDGMSKRLSAAGAQMANFRTVIGGAGAGLALRNLIGTTLTFEQSMNKVQSVTWATGQQMLLMRDQAKDLGRTTQFSASQAAEAMSFLGMAGLNTSEILEVMPGMLDLAAAGGLDLASSADIATNVLAAFGLELSKIGHLGDVLATAAAKSNTNVFELAEAMKNVASTAHLAGVGVEETTAGLMVLANAGIKGGEAGTQLMNAFRALTAMAPKTTKALRRLGIDPAKMLDSEGKVRDFTGLVTQLAAKGATLGDLFQIFDIRGAKAMGILKESGDKALSSFTRQLIDSEGNARKMADMLMQGLPGAVKKAASAWEGLKLTMMKAFVVPLSNMLERLAKFMSWLQKTHPVVLKWGTILLMASVGISAVIVPLGIMAAMVGAMLPAIAGLTAAIGAITFPLSATATLLITLGALFTGMLAKSANFRMAIGNLVDALSPLGEALKVIARLIGKGIGIELERSGIAIQNWGNIFATVLNGIAAMIKTVFNLIEGLAQAAAALSVGEGIEKAFNVLKESLGFEVATEKAARTNNKIEVTGEIGVRAGQGSEIESADIGLNQGLNLATF